MRREGRQHGMVRTYHVLPPQLNPRPSNHRVVNKVDSPTTAGIFTKVSNKPTNHSKFTGKCDRPGCAACHIHAGCKSKDKSKGAHKLRSSDTAVNYKLITWRVMDDRPLDKVRVSGFSATRILDELATSDHGDGVYETEYDHYDDDYHDYDGNITYHDYEMGNVNHEDNIVDDDDKDGDLGFYDVAVMWDPVDDDEGWSHIVAGEM